MTSAWRITVCAVAVTLVNCGSIDLPSPEVLALADIARLHRAEDRFRSANMRYGSLEELGPTHANLITRELAEGASNGYWFSLRAKTDSYQIDARPIHWGSDGRRSFFSDQTRIVRQSWTNEPANARSEELK